MTNADCFCNKNNIHIHSTVQQNAIVVFEKKHMTKYTNKRTKYMQKKWEMQNCKYTTIDMFWA